MAQAPAAPAFPAETHVDRGLMAQPTVQAPPLTPGKVAMWLFLGTEIMFFTGLIGSYVVLRAGSPPAMYSNLYPPATALEGLEDTQGVVIQSVGSDQKAVVAAIERLAGKTADEAEAILHGLPHALVTPLQPDQATQLARALTDAGATSEIEPLETFHWPEPYHTLTNPLSIDLTAVNTFILICSSVTMVLALAAIQRGDKTGLLKFLGATILIGSVFLGVQVYEYYSLMIGHHLPIGVSADHHFRPSSSLFASCFFTMTGFHGAHVAGGIILLTCIFIAALRGRYSHDNHSSVELAGLYWHFVDLVWIILFTVVYLI